MANSVAAALITDDVIRQITALGAYFSAFIGFIGALIGIALTWLYQRSNKRNEIGIQKRLEIYTKYCEAVSEIAMTQKLLIEFSSICRDLSPEDASKKRLDISIEINKSIARYTSAKAALVLYSSPDIVTAVAKFEETGAQLNDPTALTAFVNIMQQIRRESKKPVDDRYVKLVLFGNG